MNIKFLYYCKNNKDYLDYNEKRENEVAKTVTTSKSFEILHINISSALSRYSLYMVYI